MKTTIQSAAAIVAGMLLASPVLAQQPYPAKPIRVIVTVGGGIETVVRLVNQGLSQSFGQPVVLETQPGAGGSIGQETVMKAAPDGYTLLFSVASTHITNGFLSKQSRFDPVKSYTPIAKVAESILLVTVDAALPVNSVTQLVEYAKKNPGKVTYGTTGVGSVHHFSAEAISALTGIEWVHVPYKTGPAVLTDTMSGQVQVGWAILSTLAPFAKSGKLRVIGINGDKRYSGMPDIPTISEQIKGYEAPPTWAAYFGPAGLPQPLVTRLNGDIVKIATTPDVRAKIEASGSIVSTSSPEELGDRVRRDLVSVAKVVKLTGIKPE